MNRKKQLVFFLLFFIVCGLFAEEVQLSMEKQIESLGSEDKAEREKVYKLLSKKRESFPIIKAYFFPEISDAISKLGAEDWTQREQATKLLIKYGGPLEDQLKKLAKEEKDPEIRMRCKRILKELKKDGSTVDEKAFHSALFFLSEHNADTEILRPFLRKFLKRFPYSPPLFDKVKFSVSAIKKSAKDPALYPYIKEVIKRIKTSKDIKILLSGLEGKENLFAIELVSKILNTYFGLDRNLKRKVLLMPEAKVLILKSLNKEDIFDLSLMNFFDGEPTFKRIYKEHAKEFLSSTNFSAFALGVELASDDLIEQYFPIIIERLKKEIGDKSGSYYCYCIILDSLKESSNGMRLLYPHIDILLDSGSSTMIEFAIKELASLDPKKHKEKIIDLYDIPEAKSNHLAVKFLLHHFPKDRPMLIMTLIQKIKKCNNKKETEKLLRLSETLHDFFKYKGDDLDGWWSKLMSSDNLDEDFRKNLTKQAGRLNISPKILLLHFEDLLKYDQITSLKALDAGNKEEQIKCRERILHNMATNCSRHNIVELAARFLKKQPKEHLGVFLALFQGLKRLMKERNSTFIFPNFYGYYSMSKEFMTLSEALHDHPENVKKSINTVLNEKPNCRVTLAALLLLASAKVAPEEQQTLSKQLMEQFDEMITKDKGYFLIALLTSQDYKTCAKIFNLLIKDKKVTSTHFYRWQMAYYFNGDDIKGIPFLEKALFNAPENDKSIRLANALLYIDCNNKAAIAFLRKMALTGPLKLAVKAYRISGNVNHSPQIPKERLEAFYATAIEYASTINKGLANSKVKPEIIADLIRPHLPKNAASGNAFYEMFDAQPKVSELLLPQIIELTKNGTPEERRGAWWMLANCIDNYRPHIATAEKSLSEENDEKTIKAMLNTLGCAGTGVKSAKFAEIIKKRFLSKQGMTHYYACFALAIFSPSKEEREGYVDELLQNMESKLFEDSKMIVAMLGHIHEFYEKIHPEIIKILSKKNLTEIKYKVLWALTKKQPFSQMAKDAFRKEMNNLIKGEISSYNDAILWIIAKYPEELSDLIPMIKQIRDSEKHTESGSNAIRKLRVKGY